MMPGGVGRVVRSVLLLVTVRVHVRSQCVSTRSAPEARLCVASAVPDPS
jgi:hypothetical protein